MGPPKACKAYKLCASLAGDCCPNGAGATLDCCRGGLIEKATSAPKPAPKPTPKKEEKEEPKPSPAPKPKASSHKEKEEAPAPSAPSPKLETVDFAAATPKACKAYTQCATLAGDCCPNGAGATLDCCRGGLVEKATSAPKPA